MKILFAYFFVWSCLQALSLSEVCKKTSISKKITLTRNNRAFCADGVAKNSIAILNCSTGNQSSVCKIITQTRGTFNVDGVVNCCTILINCLNEDSTVSKKGQHCSFENISESLHSNPNSKNVLRFMEILENCNRKNNKISNKLADKILMVINDIVLNISQNILVNAQIYYNACGRIVKTVQNLMESIEISESKPFQRNLTNLVVDVSKISDLFSGLSISYATKTGIRKRFQDNITKSQKEVEIILPRQIFSDTKTDNKRKRLTETIVFILYKNAKFFQDNYTLQLQSQNSSERINGLIIGVHIKGRNVSNLTNPVKIPFPSLREGHKSSTKCMFWDDQLWSPTGCTYTTTLVDGRVLCHCTHLTSFTILMDINYHHKSTPHDRVLSIISYTGCALSLVGLVLTILTIILFRDVRKNTPAQILLNFCVSLTMTLVVFLAGAERSRTFSMTGCRIAAIALHYFVLTTFMWMAISAFGMYLAFVKVVNSYFPKFMLKCNILGWGIPVLVVAITIPVALGDYGDSKFCTLTGVPFFVAFLAPVLLVLTGNTIIFSLIIRSLLKTESNVPVDLKIAGKTQARQGIAIFVLLGLTWLFGVFSFRDARIVFQYLFCIFNSLQGFLVFLFYCLMSPATRESYRRFFTKHFCYDEKKRKARKSREYDHDNAVIPSAGENIATKENYDGNETMTTVF